MTINISAPKENPDGVAQDAKETTQEVKKGRPSWKPATMLDVKNKTPNYRYRWVWIDDMNLEKKQAEGWVFVNKETGVPGEHEHPGKTGDGKPLDSAKKYRDTVLMALPEELGKERDRFFNNKTEEQTLDAKKFLEQKKSRAGNPAQTYEPTIIR